MNDAVPEGQGERAPTGHVGAVDWLLGQIDRGVKVVIVATIGIMVTVVVAQVFLRYLAGSSIGWADEVSRLAFVASVFLAIPIGVRSQSHIGIELLTSKLPASTQSGLFRFMSVLSALLMLVVAYQSAKVALDQWDERMASLEFSAGWFLVPVAFGAVHSALHLLRIAVYGQYRRTHHITALE